MRNAWTEEIERLRKEVEFLWMIIDKRDTQIKELKEKETPEIPTLEDLQVIINKMNSVRKKYYERQQSISQL